MCCPTNKVLSSNNDTAAQTQPLHTPRQTSEASASTSSSQPYTYQKSYEMMVKLQNLCAQCNRHVGPLTPDLANQLVDTADDILNWANWFAGRAHDISNNVNATSSPKQPGEGAKNTGSATHFLWRSRILSPRLVPFQICPNEHAKHIGGLS